jgi:HPt (histidine-containing phosphotransfer) domain-containing protein
MSVESLPSECVFDVAGTLARFGGDRELFLEMTGFFLEDAPCLFAELREAVSAQDATAIRMKAHALKGLVAGCGGVRAASAAQRVETAGQMADLADIGALTDNLEDELEQLTQAVLDYRG